jgi:ubiquinone/menaquinone biosynthesis C-methylase UbiE
MTEKSLSLQEVEELSYYDFMSYLGASFFQIGGPKSTLQLTRQCKVDKNSMVLDVGCGTGYNAVLIAKGFGCTVIGVDIAEVSIQKALKRAHDEGITDKVTFRIGDAYELPFEDGSFDVILTEFVSQFLDMKRALNEFKRVLRSGGRVGINEMYKDSQIPITQGKEIQEAEDTIAELTELPFKLHSPEHWEQLFEEAGLVDIEINKSQEVLGLKDTPFIIREMGGPWRLFNLLWKMTKYTLLSKKLRKRFMGLQKVKAVFLRKKLTKKHVGYILGSGKKPLKKVED